mmetsp:Transcript_134769/g.340770  ORF Transcript_134769/g.340770 Transcript_134769/m.340770 type:complete len:312 (+) Transcript_134769:113-1048(+)
MRPSCRGGGAIATATTSSPSQGHAPRHPAAAGALLDHGRLQIATPQVAHRKEVFRCFVVELPDRPPVRGARLPGLPGSASNVVVWRCLSQQLAAGRKQRQTVLAPVVVVVAALILILLLLQHRKTTEHVPSPRRNPPARGRRQDPAGLPLPQSGDGHDVSGAEDAGLLVSLILADLVVEFDVPQGLEELRGRCPRLPPRELRRLIVCHLVCHHQAGPCMRRHCQCLHRRWSRRRWCRRPSGEPSSTDSGIGGEIVGGRQSGLWGGVAAQRRILPRQGLDSGGRLQEEARRWDSVDVLAGQLRRSAARTSYV